MKKYCMPALLEIHPNIYILNIWDEYEIKLISNTEDYENYSDVDGVLGRLWCRSC